MNKNYIVTLWIMSLILTSFVGSINELYGNIMLCAIIVGTVVFQETTNKIYFLRDYSDIIGLVFLVYILRDSVFR